MWAANQESCNDCLVLIAKMSATFLAQWKHVDVCYVCVCVCVYVCVCMCVCASVHACAHLCVYMNHIHANTSLSLSASVVSRK